MRLSDLEPRFVRYESKIETYDVIVGDPSTWHQRGEPTEPKTGPREYIVNAESLDQAQGLWFLCPKCGNHQCQVTFEGRGVPATLGTQNDKGPVRWTVSGTSFEDLTITPSILLIGGCGWHGFIRAGVIIHA